MMCDSPELVNISHTWLARIWFCYRLHFGGFSYSWSSAISTPWIVTGGLVLTVTRRPSVSHTWIEIRKGFWLLHTLYCFRFKKVLQKTSCISRSLIKRIIHSSKVRYDMVSHDLVCIHIRRQSAILNDIEVRTSIMPILAHTTLTLRL